MFSFAGVTLEVKRPISSNLPKILENNRIVECAGGLARCIQHEVDHLDEFYLHNEPRKLKTRMLNSSVKSKSKSICTSVKTIRVDTFLYSVTLKSLPTKNTTIPWTSIVAEIDSETKMGAESMTNETSHQNLKLKSGFKNTVEASKDNPLEEKYFIILRVVV